jgi:hypothetical protein
MAQVRVRIRTAGAVERDDGPLAWSDDVEPALGNEAAVILFEKLHENAGAIRRVGECAVAEAKRLGVSSHYMDPSLCDGIIREMPDGTRQHVVLKDKVEVVIETFGPRCATD